MHLFKRVIILSVLALISVVQCLQITLLVPSIFVTSLHSFVPFRPQPAVWGIFLISEIKGNFALNFPIIIILNIFSVSESIHKNCIKLSKTNLIIMLVFQCKFHKLLSVECAANNI